jgi:glycosyltransferase involved in cell wall biosynthesis
MNILYVLNSGNMGGMERHVLELSAGMVENGQNVFVWCTEGEMSKKYSEKGARVFIEKINHDIDFSYIQKLKRFIKDKKIDVVHAHELKAVTQALIAGRLAGVKVKISNTHTPISAWRVNRIKKLVDIVANTLLVNLLSDREIALTQAASRKKQMEGISPRKISVIPNALDTSYLTLSEQDRVSYREQFRGKYAIPVNGVVFGCVGRLTREKGHEILIKAFEKLVRTESRSGNNFYLLLAGGGPLEEELRKLSADLSIENKVIFTGTFDDRDKIIIYSAMDVFVFPSYAEGFGIVLVEAMYLGLPIIASDIDVLHEVGGDVIRYFKTGSHTDLANEMGRIYKDIKSNSGLRLQEEVSRAKAEFTMSGFINNYLNLYKSLL